MSTQLEVKRLIAEFYRCKSAKMEQDHKISEREAEIERLRENMDNQDKHLEVIREQLRTLNVDPDKI